MADERAVVVVEEVLEPVDGVEIEVVGGLVEEQRFGLAEEGLGEQDADFLAALELGHFALVDGFGNVEAVEEDGGVGFGGVSVFVADDAFELAESHAVGVGEFGLLVDAVALFEGGPERLVAHDDGVDDAIGVEGELVLTEDAEFARADDGAFLRVELAGEDLHEGGFAGAVGAGESVAAAGDKADADVFKEDLRAVAHGDVADTEHSFLVPICWPQRGIGCAGRMKLKLGHYLGAHTGSPREIAVCLVSHRWGRMLDCGRAFQFSKSRQRAARRRPPFVFPRNFKTVTR